MLKGRVDSTDLAILRLLIGDGRLSYIQIAQKLSLHKDTVRKRVQNLMTRKVIDRFTIMINQERLTELYPNLWTVVFNVKTLRDHGKLVKELIEHRNVIEVDEATPSAVHDIVTQTQFQNLEEYVAFTNWLKAKPNIDSARLTVTPISKQHRRSQRIIAIAPDDN